MRRKLTVVFMSSNSSSSVQGNEPNISVTKFLNACKGTFKRSGQLFTHPCTLGGLNINLATYRKFSDFNCFIKLGFSEGVI